MTEQFNIEQFNPTTAELMAIADKYRWIKICWLEDYKWMDLALEAKRDLASKRIYITKTLKTLRDWAIKFQKDVIVKEKELVWIVEEVENEIKAEIQKVEDEKERLKRIESMPFRMEDLTRLWLEKEYTEEFILSMDYKSFCDFIQCEKARIADEMLSKIEAEKIEKQRLLDLEEAEARWKAKAEEEAKLKELQRIQNEQADKAHKEMLDELEKQKAEDAKQAAELQKQAEQERLEKATKYRSRLADNWYTEENKSEYKIDKELNTVILYKKISTFNI